MFLPVFETSDGHGVIVKLTSFVSQTEDEAWKIALGAMFVECVIFGLTFTSKIIEIEEGEELPHVNATIGGKLPVFIISGPLFDSAKFEGE